MAKRDTLFSATTLMALPGAALNCSNTMICAAGFGVNGAAYMRNSFSRRAMAQRYLDVLEHGTGQSENALEPIHATAA